MSTPPPARPLRVLFADDELLARKRLARLLTEVEGVEIVAQCTNTEETLERVRAGGVDVALLDIHMPGLSGIDALAMMQGGPAVVFCTAHADHAVSAFDGGAVDYLLKPIELGRLKKAVARARERVEAARPAAGRAETRPAPPERLAIATRQGIVLVDPERVTHAVLDGALVSVVTTDAEYVTDFSLGELEAKLPRLSRVHRRALLNLAHVTRLEPLETGGYVARTTRGHAVEVSRQAARELRKRLGLRRSED